MIGGALRAGLIGSALLVACSGQPADSTATSGVATDDPSAGHSTTSGAATDTSSGSHTSSNHTSSGEASSSGQTSAAGSGGATSEATASDTGTDTDVAASDTGTDTDVAASSGSSGDTGEQPLGWGCGPQWPETGPVQGETPIGALAFKYAGFDPDGCDKIEGIRVYLFPEMPVLTEDLDLPPNPVRLDVELTGGGWSGNWVSEGTVHVRLVDKDHTTLGEADGILDVTMLDITDTSYMSDGGLSHWLVGELHVDAPGWALHGGFTAAICWMMEGFTLCP